MTSTLLASPPTVEGVMARLRILTRANHDTTEREPLAVALVQQTATREQLALLHQAYLMIHQAIEERVEHDADPRFSSVWRPEQRRVEDLRADLAELESEGVRPHVSIDCAKAVASAVRIAHGSPPRVLGALYVLEGSRLGGVYLAPRVAAIVGRPLRYYAGHGVATMPAWRAFSARMDAALPVNHDEVIGGAAAAFAAIGGVMSAVWAAAPPVTAACDQTRHVDRAAVRPRD